MTKNHAEADRTRGLALGSVLALFFLLLELTKDCRDSQWSGLDATDWLRVAAGGVLYGAVLALLSTGAVFVLCKLARGAWRRDTCAAVSVIPAGGALWAFLSVFREFRPTFEDALVLLGLAGLAFALLVLPRFARMSFGEVCGAAAVSLAAGIAALAATGRLFLFDVQRAAYVAWLSIAWTGAAGLVSLAVWRGKGRLRWLHRPAHAVLALGAPLLAAHIYTDAAGTRDDRPNVVLVVADTLRADLMRLYGGPVPMPRIEALAERGAVFDRAYSLAPWTPPSMTGLFTSQYPPGLTPGAPAEAWLDQLWRYDVPRERQTPAEMLRERGYRTGAIQANALLTALDGMNEGFETRAFSHPMLLRPGGFFAHLPFLRDALASLCPLLAPVRPQDTSSALTRYAKAYINRHASEPFFLWVHYMDPHAPYDPPPEYRAAPGPWPFFHPFPGGERWDIPIVGRGFDVSEPDRAYVRCLYEGEMRHVDACIGDLLDCLDVADLRDCTYVCFLADHGEELWEHGEWGHGQSLFEELLHVPLVIVGPGVQPRRIAHPVSLIDVLPTLAELAGFDRDPSWCGTDLTPVLRDNAALPPDRPVFALATSNKAWPEPLQMVRLGSEKLIREAGSGLCRLYDLGEDPGETTDLADRRPERKKALEAFLLNWLDTFPNAFDIETTPDENARRDSVRQQLDAMGYLH